MVYRYRSQFFKTKTRDTEKHSRGGSGVKDKMFNPSRNEKKQGKIDIITT
jgi:hypothetical protein